MWFCLCASYIIDGWWEAVGDELKIELGFEVVSGKGGYGAVSCRGSGLPGGGAVDLIEASHWREHRRRRSKGAAKGLIRRMVYVG